MSSSCLAEPSTVLTRCITIAARLRANLPACWPPALLRPRPLLSVRLSVWQLSCCRWLVDLQEAIAAARGQGGRAVRLGAAPTGRARGGAASGEGRRGRWRGQPGRQQHGLQPGRRRAHDDAPVPAAGRVRCAGGGCTCGSASNSGGCGSSSNSGGSCTAHGLVLVQSCREGAEQWQQGRARGLSSASARTHSVPMLRHSCTPCKAA